MCLRHVQTESLSTKYTVHRAERAGAVEGDDAVFWREASERSKDLWGGNCFDQVSMITIFILNKKAVDVNKCDQHQCFQAVLCL